MTGVHVQCPPKQGQHSPKPGLCTPTKGQHRMQSQGGNPHDAHGVRLQRRDTSGNAHGVRSVKARHHSHSDKKLVKHRYKAFHSDSSYSASFDSAELDAHHPLPESRCNQLRRRIDPRGHLREILGLCAPYQDHADGDSLWRDRGPKLVKKIIFEGIREQATRLVSSSPLRPLSGTRNASSFHVSRASSTHGKNHALRHGATSVVLLPSDEPPLLLPSERSPGSGGESARKSSCSSHEEGEHAPSPPTLGTRPPSPGPAPALVRLSARTPETTVQPSMGTSEAARLAASSPSEGRIQIFWQPPSGASLMRDFFPERASSFPAIDFSVRRGRYWGPRSV
jgi:hypothetical protein